MAKAAEEPVQATEAVAKEKIQVNSIGSQTCALENLTPDSFYAKVRPLAFFNKLFGTFPIKNIGQRDGRKLQHSWLCLWQLYDVVLCVGVLLCFYFSVAVLLNCVKDEEERYRLMLWLNATFYMSAARGVITFFVSHIYARKLPELFHAMEEYHQGLGVYVIKRRTGSGFQKVIPIVVNVVTLLMLELTSYLYFVQFTGSESDWAAWPAVTSFMFMYAWKELPINMFMCMLMHLIFRFDEIRGKLKEVRLRDDKDSSCDLESHRLQFAALVNVLNLLQKCYGLQLAVNVLFLIIETIVQMFIYIVISESKNFFLLNLSIYNFCMAGVFVFILDRVERKGDHVLEELSNMRLNAKSELHQLQVQLFISQVLARPVKISASGFFTINNSLLGSLFGAIATYLIVMIQFAPYITESTNNSSAIGNVPHVLLGQQGHVYRLMQ